MNNKTRLKINNETIKSKIIRYIKPGFIIFNVLLILVSISSAATSQTPYSGTALKVPGTIQAENFDLGGEGIAYHDTETANQGNQYRPADGVDIEITSDIGGGYNIGWTLPGEWLGYTVNVANTGNYKLEARVAYAGTGGTFHIEFNGVDKTGPITVPDTGSYQTWTTLTKSVSLSAGQQVMKIVMDKKGDYNVANINYIRITSLQSPYSGTPWAIPGTIQAENFDLGGEGIAYHDTEIANQGNQYRPADGVDTEITSDIGGGYNIGWTLPGEWLEYTVKVANNGNYNLETRVAYAGTGGTFHIEFNGVDKTGPITVPDTGSYQTWTTVTKTVSLSAGQQVMKIVMDNIGDWNVANINYIRITPTSTLAPAPIITPAKTPTSTPTLTPAPISTPSPIVSGAFYVATNGNDANPGTEAQPWRTITKAANTLSSGQTVYVKNGIYNERIYPKNNGISFISQNPRGAIIDGSGLGTSSDWSGLITINGQKDISFNGFEVRNAKTFAYHITGGTNIMIKNNYIHDISISSVYAVDSFGITMDGNEVMKVETKIGLPSDMIGQETVSFLNVNGFEIKNNKFYNNNFENIAIKVGSKNGKVHNNDIQPVESAGIYLYGWKSTEPVIEYIEIYNNRIHDSPSNVRGIAIASEVGGPMRHVKIYNNLIYNNGAQGITIDAYDGQMCWGGNPCFTGKIDDIQIFSNTVYNNDRSTGWGGGIDTHKAPSAVTNVVIRNNIAWGNNGNQINTRTSDKNENNLVTDPHFINANGGDFHLQSGSSAIDKGSLTGAPSYDYDNNPRPRGTGYDIGAFEY